MRAFVLAAAFVAVAAAPALAGIGLGVEVVNPTAVPGEAFEVAVKVQNRSPSARRVTFRFRLRGHEFANAGARRYRSRLQRVRVVLEAGEERDLLLGVRVPDDAAGAVRIEVRRGRDRRTVDAWVTADDLFPGQLTRGRVPYQPVLRVSQIREFDGDQSKRTVVVRDRESWDTLLDTVRVETPAAWGRDAQFRDEGVYARPVDVDFAQETVLAIFAGSRQHVDFIRVRAVRTTSDGALVCEYQIVRRRPGGVRYAADHQWAPYAFLTIPRVGAETEIRFRRLPDGRPSSSRR